MTLFIGIEAVSMRCSVAVAADADGNILSAARGRPMAFHTMPRQELRLALRDLLLELLLQINKSLDDLQDSSVCIGLTGVTFAFDALRDLPNEFKELDLRIPSLTCTGDAEIIFASHAHCSTGSALIVHMGSTAYVLKDGTGTRFGGWGPALGDEGSGFWLGRKALRQIALEHDLKAPFSSLWREINSWLSGELQTGDIWTEASCLWIQYRTICEQNGFDPRSALFPFAHTLNLQSQAQWRATASGLAIPIIRAASLEDSAAKDILAEAARELAHQYDQVLQIAEATCFDGPFVLHGGLVVNSAYFREILVDELKRRLTRLPTILLPGHPTTMRPACGALLFALGGSTPGQLMLPNASMIDHVIKQVQDRKSKGHLSHE